MHNSHLLYHYHNIYAIFQSPSNTSFSPLARCGGNHKRKSFSFNFTKQIFCNFCNIFCYKFWWDFYPASIHFNDIKSKNVNNSFCSAKNDAWAVFVHHNNSSFADIKKRLIQPLILLFLLLPKRHSDCCLCCRYVLLL